jgi:hypothetical protein
VAGESGDAGKMREIWAGTVDRVKQQVNAISLWRALESTVPVAWEDNFFVVGIGTAEGAQAGQMNSAEHRSTIERTLQSLSGNRDLRFRVIGGTAYSDWQYEKARDAAAASQQQQTTQRRVEVAEGAANWDQVFDQMSRLWAASENRSLASGKARYLQEAVTRVVEAMDTLLPDADKSEVQNERMLSRIMERIASNSNTDPILVGYLIFERRRGS